MVNVSLVEIARKKEYSLAILFIFVADCYRITVTLVFQIKFIKTFFHSYITVAVTVISFFTRGFSCFWLCWLKAHITRSTYQLRLVCPRICEINCVNVSKCQRKRLMWIITDLLLSSGVETVDLWEF